MCLCVNSTVLKEGGYWSGSIYVNDQLYAWSVFFSDGKVSSRYKVNVLYVRCVRGGPSGSLAHLIVSKSGTGTGTVTSTPAGINCGAVCDGQFSTGTRVTLRAAADSGSKFTGWSGGGCSGAGACTVTVNGDVTVTATFDQDAGHSISGTVRIGSSSGSPLSGATMSLTGASTKSASTNASGYYAFTGLPNGAYTLIPSKDQYSFSPANRMINLNGADLAARDFIAALKTGSLQVTLSPSDAIEAGARWQVDGGAQCC